MALHFFQGLKEQTQTELDDYINQYEQRLQIKTETKAGSGFEFQHLSSPQSVTTLRNP